MMSCRSSGSTPDLTSGGQLLGDFEVAITGGIWVAAGDKMGPINHTVSSTLSDSPTS
jgi:hypothetical protein